MAGRTRGLRRRLGNMIEDEDRSRWGSQDPDDAPHASDTTEPTPSEGDDFEPEASESDEEAVVGVQPGTEADVPFNDVPAETEEATTDGSE